MAAVAGMTTNATTRTKATDEATLRQVTLASSLGTLFEWYDFYLYGSLASFFGGLFFPAGNETAQFLASLATFGAGFAVRPVGAVFFGRLGDVVGRKYSFLLTIMIMGVSTAAIGLLPTYSDVGTLAPVLLVSMRLLQGLALGGEYGGAVSYVAEYAPPDRKGYFTGYVQTTATLGLMLSLLVIMGTRVYLGETEFRMWGWRQPFFLSFVLLGVSVYLRLSLRETPMFRDLMANDQKSKGPVGEALFSWRYGKWVLLALFGATAGQAVIWYGGQFYALYFLTATLKVDYRTAYTLLIIALAAGTPFFVVFGSLSDRIGRKPIIMLGLLIAAITYIPIYKGLTSAANPKLAKAIDSSPVTLIEPAACEAKCEKAREFLVKAGVPFTSEPGDDLGMKVAGADSKGFTAAEWKKNLNAAGYPDAAKPEDISKVTVVLLLFVLVIFVTMVYGPIAAFLCELFPTRIRYTGLSVPYHFGNGWFGGFTPLIGTSITASTGNIYAGLYWMIGVALMSLVIGGLLLPETKDRALDSDI
ncbi:MAG: MHS family MFS transporter [Myxococcales bacterium]|nr:MHS family MFS transporter [Myxococcales bacterium]